MKIEGKNSVYEALHSDMTVNSLMCEKGNDGPIVQFARKKGVKITFVDKTVLDKTSAEGRHQGYIADVTLLDNKGTFHGFDVNTNAEVVCRSFAARVQFLQKCFI